MIGTPEYMSPEQVEGKDVDQRSDIYSLGVILYEMVTGKVPFEGETPLSIAYKHKHEVPQDPRKLNAQVPEDFSHLILKCMEKDKEKRYQDAEDLLSELTSIEKGIPTTERAVPERKPITAREITVTFGLKKLFIPALAVIAAVIIGVIIWRLLPQKEAVLAPKIDNSIAVISFKNQTGDKDYNYLQEAIPNLLITNLENTGYLYVATWERMRDLLKQTGKQDVEVIDRDLGFELCRMDGIGAIVLGSFIKAGDMFATDVKVLDVETKRLLKSTSSKGKGIDSILESQIDELSKEISKGVGIAREKIEEPQVRIVDVTTNSMEAYNYYLRGKEEVGKLYPENARKFLEKAVELDPSFAMAYCQLGRANYYLQNTKASTEAFKKAKSLSEKATEKERLYIEADYVWFIERNLEEAISIFTQIVKKYPKEKDPHMWIGFYYGQKKLFTEAIEEYNKALELDPNYGEVIMMLAYAYAEIGNFEKAIEYFKRYASVSPGDANPFDSMAEIYLKMGGLDEAIAKYKEALEVKPDFGSDLAIAYIYALKEDYSEAMKWIDQYIAISPSKGKRANGFFSKGFYSSWLGNLERALKYLRTAADLAQEVGNEQLKASTDWMKGWFYYDRGELELSQNHFKSWFDFMIESPSALISISSAIPTYTATYRFSLGLIKLKQGQIDTAKSILDEMKSLLPKITTAGKDQITFYYDLLHGEVLLAEGSIEEAIAVCEKISPLGMPDMATGDIEAYNVPFLKDVLARAYLKKGKIEKVIAEYERLITFDPKSQERYLIHPKFHYRLGKLYEEKGQKGKAIKQYEKFLDLWKDADSGIAEVEDAEQRLARLQKE